LETGSFFELITLPFSRTVWAKLNRVIRVKTDNSAVFLNTMLGFVIWYKSIFVVLPLHYLNVNKL
jgi:hypothetical protein